MFPRRERNKPRLVTDRCRGRRRDVKKISLINLSLSLTQNIPAYIAEELCPGRGGIYILLGAVYCRSGLSEAGAEMWQTSDRHVRPALFTGQTCPRTLTTPPPHDLVCMHSIRPLIYDPLIQRGTQYLFLVRSREVWTQNHIDLV